MFCAFSFARSIRNPGASLLMPQEFQKSNMEYIKQQVSNCLEQTTGPLKRQKKLETTDAGRIHTFSIRLELWSILDRELL